MTASIPAGDGPAGPPASKTTYAHTRLREEIVNGSIRPGEPLRQADIARRFGISPTPVREALRLLEAEGMIRYSSHRGATATELSEDRIRDLYLLRSSSESLATRLAVERMEPEALEGIDEAHVRLTTFSSQADADGKQLAAWNREWHHRIYAAGSPFISSQIMTLWRMFPTRSSSWQDRHRVERYIEEHSAIMNAIHGGEAERAGALMSEHVTTAAGFRLDMIHYAH